MNSFMQGQWAWVEGSHAMRSSLLDILNDADLSFNPGGQNMTLGALCREFGEIEHSYVQSLKNFKQDWLYRHNEAGIETSVEKLRAWYQALDDEMKAVASAFSEEDLQKSIERGSGYKVPITTQFEIYLQALLIFFGKATIYLKAMNKSLPESIREWIG